MKSTRFFLALAVCLAAVFLWCAPPLAAQTFDARNDFSLQANPNGVWSYGTLSAVAGGVFSTFSFLTIPEVGHDYTAQLIWSNGESYPVSSTVQANDSGGSVTVSGTVLYPTDQLDLDGKSHIAAVRWTAPADGVYNVSGFFQRNDNQTNVGPVAVTVSIVQNSTAVRFQQADFVTFQSRTAFDLPALPLLAGTTLDFVENADVPHNDTVGLAATITYAGALTGPIVSVSATVPVTVAGSGTPGIFTLTRSGDPSQKLVVHYTVKGSARGGFNYAALNGKAKFKPGKSTATVAVNPINQADALAKSLVKIVLTPAGNFYVGEPDRAKIKIVNPN